MFKSTLNRGFQLTFKNRLTISVQFGSGNYCSNKNLSGKVDEMRTRINTSLSAEIAIWDENDNNYKFKNGELSMGWLSTDEVAEWIEKVKKAKNINDLK